MKKLLLIFLLMFVLVGCDQTSTTVKTEGTTTVASLDYSDFIDITLITPSSQLSQNYDTYYLYYFSVSCPHCTEIKTEVLSKIDSLTKDHVFLVQVSKFSDINSNINVQYTPSLVRIINGEVDKIFVGKDDILPELNGLD